MTYFFGSDLWKFIEKIVKLSSIAKVFFVLNSLKIIKRFGGWKMVKNKISLLISYFNKSF